MEINHVLEFHFQFLNHFKKSLVQGRNGRGETEYLRSKIAKGQVADVLGKQAKPTLLSQQRIEGDFVPKQFLLKPGYHKPDEDYSAEQLPTVTSSMVRDAFNCDKRKAVLAQDPASG